MADENTLEGKLKEIEVEYNKIHKILYFSLYVLGGFIALGVILHSKLLLPLSFLGVVFIGYIAVGIVTNQVVQVLYLKELLKELRK